MVFVYMLDKKTVLVRGTIFLMVANLVTIFSSYLIHIGLARFLGPAAYGNFGVILSIIFVTKILFLTGITLGISKLVSEKPNKAFAIYKFGFRIQFLIMCICILFFLFFSKIIAKLLGDNSLSNLILLSSLVIFTLGLYSMSAKGLLNGLHMFNSQAFFESLLSILRFLIVFALVNIGWGLFGAVFAYSLAPLLVYLIIKIFSKKWHHRKVNNFDKITKSDKKELLWFAVPITIYYVLFTFTTEYGILAVKRFLADDIQTGLYAASTTISKITQSLFTALPLTILPAISSAVMENDSKLIKKYLTQSMRYAILVIFPVTVLISTNSRELILLLYSESFSAAAPVLRILAFGFAFLALFLSQGSFLLGLKKLKVAVGLVFINVIVMVTFIYILVPKQGILGVAVATTITGIVAFLITSLYLIYTFGTMISARSFANIIFSSIIIYETSSYLKFSGKWFIVSAILNLLLYYLVLFLLQEIKSSDRKLVSSILQFKK
jgi:O-antigen/teichoic acid export membrane protein